MKKALKIIRNLIVFVLWTFLFVFLSQKLFILIWNFDILSPYSWNIISDFWNKGGSFKTYQDIIFLTLLLSLPFLYFFGLRKAKKLNYANMFLAVFHRFFNEKIDEPERIVLKGMKSTQQYVDDVKNELESLKPEKNQEASSIRANVLKKISEETKK